MCHRLFPSFSSRSREVGWSSSGPEGLVQGEMEQNRTAAQLRSSQHSIAQVGAGWGWCRGWMSQSDALCPSHPPTLCTSQSPRSPEQQLQGRGAFLRGWGFCCF